MKRLTILAAMLLAASAAFAQPHRSEAAVRALMEDPSRAGNNKIVHFESPTAKIGDFVNVKIERASIWCVKGSEVL